MRESGSAQAVCRRATLVVGIVFAALGATSRAGARGGPIASVSPSELTFADAVDDVADRDADGDLDEYR